MDAKSFIRLYNRQASEIPGFLNRKQALVWKFFFEEQATIGLSGSAVEIGVFQGRSAVVIGALLGPDDRLLLIDPFKAPEIERRMATIAPGCTFDFLPEGSESAAAENAISAMSGNVRFFHVDGHHTAECVRHELKLAEAALHEDGLVCIDDFFSERYPEVSLGVFDALRSGSLRFLFSAFNKCYLAREPAHRAYYDALEARFIPWMREAADFDTFTLFRSAGELTGLSLGKRYKDADVYGPD